MVEPLGCSDVDRTTHGDVRRRPSAACASLKPRGRSSSAAPISEVALRAGVGIAALYHRYPSKNAFWRSSASTGKTPNIELVEKALASTDDPWTAYVQWHAEHRCRRPARTDGPSHGLFTPDERHAAPDRADDQRHVELFSVSSRPVLCVPDAPRVAFLLEQRQDQTRRCRPDGRTQAAPTRHHHRPCVHQELLIYRVRHRRWQEQSRWTPVGERLLNPSQADVLSQIGMAPAAQG